MSDTLQTGMIYYWVWIVAGYIKNKYQVKIYLFINTDIPTNYNKNTKYVNNKHSNSLITNRDISS